MMLGIVIGGLALYLYLLAHFTVWLEMRRWCRLAKVLGEQVRAADERGKQYGYKSDLGKTAAAFFRSIIH